MATFFGGSTPIATATPYVATVNGQSGAVVVDVQTDAEIAALLAATTDLGALAPAVQALIDAASALDRNRNTHSGVDNPNLNEQFASYTLQLTDAQPQTVIRMNLAADNSVTVPASATVAIPVGTRIPIDQWGDGQTSIVAAAGVTIRSSASLDVKAKYSRVWLEKQSTDEWLLTGDIALGGPVGSPPVCTVPPSISGTAVSGSTLTRTAGTWTGTPTPTISGQWYANAVAIGGQTASTYVTANPGDDGKAITYRESAVSTAGGPTQATSNSITMTPAAATKPVSTGVLPVITGSAVVGATLTCSTGGWTNSPTSHKYIWKDGATTLEDTGYLTPGTTDTYVVLVGQTGRTITCQVTAQNASGIADVAVTSAGTPIAAGPTSSSRTIPAAGTTMSVVFSSAVNSGASGFNTGISVSASGGAVTATYSSGTGTTTLVYTLSRTIQQGETLSLTYTQPGAFNGIKSSTTGAYVASFVGSTVTNNSTQSAAITWEGPLTISTGGTHNITNRNIRSTDPLTAAITVNASCTLNITNCRIESMFDGLRGFVTMNLTLTGTTFKAVNPNVSNREGGRFIDIDGGNGTNTIIIENNTFHGGGLKLSGGSVGTLRVRYNSAVNINGRTSNGAGGYVTESGGTGFERYQLLQLNNVSCPNGADIGWNQIVNTAGSSRVEDGFNLYGSSGVSGAPINMHDNYVFGGWSALPYTENFSGCCFLVEEGSNWVNVDDNVGVAYTNSGFAAWGACSNINVRRNRFICSGKLAGTTLWAPNRAAVFQTSGSSNLYEDNDFSWMGRDTGGSGALSNRGLYYSGDTSVTESGTTQLADATEAAEAAEAGVWTTKKSNAGVTTGSSIAIW